MVRIKSNFITAFSLVLVVFMEGFSMPPLELGISVGGGYTFVDMEEASGYDEDYIRDWGQGHFKVTLCGLIGINERLRVGLELGYNELYWWEVRVPYGPSPVYRSAEWWTDSYLAMAQLDFTKWLFVQAGAGLHFFDGDPVMALSAATGIKPRLGRFSIPAGLRLDPVFGDGTPTTLSLTLGIQYSL